MRAVGVMAVMLSVFTVIWMWFVNGRPRTVEHWVGYVIISGLCTAVACAGAMVWAAGGGGR